MTAVSTTQSGAPVTSDAHSKSVGADGAIILTDHYLVEKLAQFNRERVPERVVHAKGGGAFGTFKATEDISKYTTAAFLQPGVETEMLLRFSSVPGENGSPDTWRDPRGFAVKFYTTEGNYDLVGNNTPVFFIRDGIKFPDFIHSQKRLPGTHLRDADMQWDFWTLSPESAHQVTWLMGDRGLPASWREMQGYGSHTYQWINAEGERFWVKYHFKSNQGVNSMSSEQAEQLRGQLPVLGPARPGDAVRGRQDLPLQPVRPHQGVAARGLPADQGGHHGAEQEPGELLRADRAGHLCAVELRARHRRLPGQDAAGPHLLLRGRTPLPGGHQPRPDPGEPAQEPGQQLQPGRAGPLPVQRPLGSGLRAELRGRPGCRGAAEPGRQLGERRRAHPLRAHPARRGRRLCPGRNAVPRGLRRGRQGPLPGDHQWSRGRRAEPRHQGTRHPVLDHR